MNNPLPIALGPVMLDVAGTVLDADDRRRLSHPLVGGVILFSRNYESPQQLAQLTQDIHALRQPQLLIAVDHEWRARAALPRRFHRAAGDAPARRSVGPRRQESAAPGAAGRLCARGRARARTASI
jgi:beta-N-acetylhexosaminidase